MALCILVNIGLGNDLLPNCTKLLPGLINACNKDDT